MSALIHPGAATATRASAATMPSADAAVATPAPAVAVRLKSVGKRFGSVEAVRGVDLALPKGALTSLLGPSGCGKTTLLRLIAGLEYPTTGEIEIDGRSVGNLPIHKRNIGFVFQNYALFPHRTVGDNIAFGLKHRGVDASTRAAKVKRALEIVRLPGIEERYPNQLSGGQQQRVALARAFVFQPSVLLLDEPLSALDANLREEVRVEIKLIQKALGLTTVLVTHDQQEALAMSDEVVVMSEGTVQQAGQPKAVYRHPRNRFVASFLGHANVCRGQIVEAVAGQPGQWLVRFEGGIQLRGVPGGSPQDAHPYAPGNAVDVVIRGTELKLEPLAAALPSAQAGGFVGEVVDASYLGDDAHYLIDAAGVKLKATCRIAAARSGHSDDGMLLPGTQVRVSAAADACAILPAS